MIPVFDPIIGEEEILEVTNALRKGEISGSFGKYIEQFENEFSKFVGCKYGIAVTSGTAALHLAVDAAGVKAGDEVLVSASTNIATALAVYHNNAVAVPVDSENITWNLDLDLIESLITPKTKAIIPVHLFGHPVDMDRLMSIANKHDIMVIEDCAESHGATVRKKMTGSFGQMACFSFYANKIITTGEGGMIVTNDQKLADRLKLLRNLAFTTPRFWHETAGYNFRMTGYQAAMGVAQMKKINTFIDGKRKMAETYNKYLSQAEHLQLPAELEWAKNVYWMYGITVKSGNKSTRDGLMAHLKNAGIDTRTFFCPMNQQPFLISQKGFRKVNCPVADSIWERGLYLPSSVNLQEEQIEFICTQIKKFFSSKA